MPILRDVSMAGITKNKKELQTKIMETSPTRKAENKTTLIPLSHSVTVRNTIANAVWGMIVSRASPQRGGGVVLAKSPWAG